MSRWFVLCTTFGSLFIVAGKRYAELNELGTGAGTRATLEMYPLGYLRIVLSISCGAALPKDVAVDGGHRHHCTHLRKRLERYSATSTMAMIMMRMAPAVLYS